MVDLFRVNGLVFERKKIALILTDIHSFFFAAGRSVALSVSMSLGLSFTLSFSYSHSLFLSLWPSLSPSELPDLAH